MSSPEDCEFSVAFSHRLETLKQVQHLFQCALASPSEGRQVDGKTMLRRLLPDEIMVLESHCRCRSRDWSQLYLLLSLENSSASQSVLLQTLLSDTRFDGTILLDLTDDDNDVLVMDDKRVALSDWHRLPPGLHANLLVCDSIFRLKSCRVYQNSLIANTHVGSNAVIIGCGKVSTTKPVSFGRLSISVGAESGGGRVLEVTSEHTMIDICRQLRHGPSPRLSGSTDLSWNSIGKGCVLRDTPTIQNVFLHDYSSIEAATSVSHATLYSHSSIQNGSTASKVLLQWNSSIVDHSSISETLLMEHAHCGPNSIVVSSVLGPDVHVAAGEIHSSVIGPNTNAHHQSLVIGILWPLGRGNVGYGANVGSNHTGRLPDQETAAGEGVFWGLSNVIKFPVDLSFSPYSIIAAGSTLPPQRICMPFSLIVENDKVHEIIPGWVLQSSPYTLVRSEKKYATRRKAKHHNHYTGWKIFRPEIMAMCRWAWKSLETNGAGVGSCALNERAREGGIRAYRECLQRYALHGLLRWILHVTESGRSPLDVVALEKELSDIGTSSLVMDLDPMANVAWPLFPWDVKGTNEWDCQKFLLQELFPLNKNTSLWLEDSLLKLVALEKDMARRIHNSKHRDDIRGGKTIPGYAQAHIPADKDPVILEAQKYAEQIDSSVAELLTLSGTRSRL